MPTLMSSISGIRGLVGDGLDPQVLVNYLNAYADFAGGGTVVVGRDSRITGEMVKAVTIGVLSAKGVNVVDIGICPTPTVQLTVKQLGAAGGIAISASHNPNEWNALKLLNKTGQFLSPEEYEVFKSYLGKPQEYKKWNEIGAITVDPDAVNRHKEAVLNNPYIDTEKLKARKFRVVADCVNGAGFVVVPQLLRDLGCEVIELNTSRSGIFPRLPEPIPENLTETMAEVVRLNADLCVVVDPDVDRLVLITNTGEPFIEENTIAHITRFILSKKKGSVVVNLSTTRAVDDIAKAAGCEVFRAPVGEANVVKKMKETGAIIGGEGSGGVIFPELHYGRDALTGIVLTLQHLLEFGGTMDELKKSLPQYTIVKKKIEIGSKNPDELLEKVKAHFSDAQINTDDGLRIDFPDHWVHFRKSNTEPIIRAICEAATAEIAEEKMKGYFALLG